MGISGLVRCGIRLRFTPDAAYNFSMARGWESKSVEDQQAEAARKSLAPRRMLTPEQAARQRKEESLSLARTRILRQLDSAADPRYRALLGQTLEDIDIRLKQLAQVM